RGEHVMAIPGTRSIKRLEENAAAAAITLTAAELAQLDAIAPPDAAAGTRYPEAGMQAVNRCSHPAERLVDGGHPREGFGLCGGDRVFGLQLCTLGVEQAQEVADALAIAEARDVCRASALARLLAQVDESLLVLGV